MTKEDYMKLSKERLAELLAERDKYLHPNNLPFNPRPLCGFIEYCNNPFRDCIGCPICIRTFSTEDTNLK